MDKCCKNLLKTWTRNLPAQLLWFFGNYGGWNNTAQDWRRSHQSASSDLHWLARFNLPESPGARFKLHLAVEKYVCRYISAPTGPPLIKTSPTDSSARGVICGRPGLRRQTGTFLMDESCNKVCYRKSAHSDHLVRLYVMSPLIQLLLVLLELPVK